jgi:hypothetical protein
MKKKEEEEEKKSSQVFFSSISKFASLIHNAQLMDNLKS